MNRTALRLNIPVAIASFGIGALVVWMTNTSANVASVKPRLPGMDRELGGAEETAVLEPVPEPGTPIAGQGVASSIEGSWPWFRGENLDGVGLSDVSLARKWPDAGPEKLWTVDLGPGHAGAVVSGGRVFVLDYDQVAATDTMRCLSLDDGREIWNNSYPVDVTENHGRSRTVSAVVGNSVISFGPKCHVACWDVDSGECRWLLDLVRDFGATVPAWYAGQCPLIDQGQLILAPSGKAFLMAVDCESGNVLWESEKVQNWEMTHVSIAPMEFAGVRMYVYCGSRGVAGLSADDGSLLWQSNDFSDPMAACPTPVPVGDGKIFFTSGYHKDVGSVMIQLEEKSGTLRANTLYKLERKKFQSEQQTPIFFDGHLFGVRTKPGGEQLACIDLDGNEVWNSARDKFGRGPYLIADGLIYVMDDHGLLTMAEATTAGYKRLDEFQVFEDGFDAWAPMALVSGRLVLRDLSRMCCLDVSAK